MRAGLIVAGVLLQIVGFALIITIIGAVIGFPIGFIGFVMMLVGLFTSGQKIIVAPQAQQQQVVVMPPQQPPPQTPAESGDTKFCAKCGSKMPKSNTFCPDCGEKQPHK